MERLGLGSRDSLTSVTRPMQISFWKLRQSEYESYTFLYDPVKVKAVRGGTLA